MQEKKKLHQNCGRGIQNMIDTVDLKLLNGGLDASYRLPDMGQIQGKYMFIADMEFVQNFTPPDFQAKNFTPSNSPNFNSFSKKKHKK